MVIHIDDAKLFSKFVLAVATLILLHPFPILDTIAAYRIFDIAVFEIQRLVGILVFAVIVLIHRNRT